MPAKQSYEVTLALRWLKDPVSVITTERVRTAAKRFKVHESTLWRALGRMNHRRETK